MRTPTAERSARRIAAAGLGLVTVLGAACASTTTTQVDPRFIAIHNTLAAMGLAQVGPVQQGTLAEGREARLSIELPAQCTAVVAIGGAGVGDIDLAVLDAAGQTVGHDTTHEPQATVRACTEVAGTHTIVVKMAKGSGDFMTALWSGATGAVGLGVAAGPQGSGTCESPIVLASGTFQNATTKGEAEFEGEGDCDRTRGKEMIHRLDLPTRKRVVLDVEARFDTVVYVRKDDCADGEQVACNDDAPNSTARQAPSHVDTVLERGAYWVFVDSPGDGGSYRLNVQLLDVPSLADVCRQARPLVPGAPVTGSTRAAFDQARATCGDEAKGRDAVYRFDLGQRSRVRLTEHSDDYSPVVHVRRTCADPQSELACSDSGGADGDATYAGVLDPGAYHVFADAVDPDADGHFTLEAEVGPEQGSGTTGDACVDAQPLTGSAQGLQGDTFTAKDDIAGRCAGAGAPDVVYRIDLPRRSRITATFSQQDSEHVFVLQRTCGDKASEVACGPSQLDETVNAGTYFLAIDGAKPDAFGRFSFDYQVFDVGAQEAACKAPAELKAGQTVTGNTAKAGDKFHSSCAGADTQAAGDRVYRFVLGQRSLVHFALATPAHDGVLSIRRSCLDQRNARAELTCNNDSDDSHHSRIESVLDAGTYYLVVDGVGTGSEGPYTLEYKVLQTF